MPKAKPLRTHKHRAFNPYSNPESDNINDVIQNKGNNKLLQHQESKEIGEYTYSSYLCCLIMLNYLYQMMAEMRWIAATAASLLARDRRSAWKGKRLLCRRSALLHQCCDQMFRSSSVRRNSTRCIQSLKRALTVTV